MATLVLANLSIKSRLMVAAVCVGVALTALGALAVAQGGLR